VEQPRKKKKKLQDKTRGLEGLRLVVDQSAFSSGARIAASVVRTHGESGKKNRRNPGGGQGTEVKGQANGTVK